MSFLNQLKSQAAELQTQQHGSLQNIAANTIATELACKIANRYLQDLCTQLKVINPSAHGNYSLEGKTPFPALGLRNFRCDARKKMLRNQEVFDHIGMGWDLLPVNGAVAQHSVTVNFPPDLERVIQRLSIGQVKHERKELRHPDSNKLQAYVFEYLTQSRGSITVTAQHDEGTIDFRITNVGGFDLLKTSYPSAQVNQALMDELAKKLVGQGSRFG